MFNRFTVLDEEIENFFSFSEDPLKKIQELDGDIYRKTANRVTKKFELNKRTFFLKYHGPIGYIEVFKNILKFQFPTVSAKKEWSALKSLERIGVSSPSPLAIWSKGINPANSHSFIITESLEPNISIEEAFNAKGLKKISASEKIKLIKKIANICRTLHSNGLNHRDLYLCHFLIDKNFDLDKPIYLIDLHRAQKRYTVPSRWLVKDIGALFHSVIQFGMTERDCYRFLMVYFGCSLRDLFLNHGEFIKKVRKRAFSMYMKPLLSEIDISSKKPLPETSLYKKSATKDYRWIGLKDKVSRSILELIQNEDELISRGEVIKNEKGHLVVKINITGKELFVKKYRIKNLFHRFRRFFKKTRARNSWEASHWFNVAGIKTMKPILIYEKLDLIGPVDSILVSEEINGIRLDKKLEKNHDTYKIASTISNFFKRLLWISFNHGDAKSSNFFVNENKLVVFDLDSSKRFFLASSLKRKIKRDKRRINRSLKGSVNLASALNLRIKDK